MKGPKRRRMNKEGRNDGEQYLTISYRMAKSDAWRSLSGAAARLWVELRSRYNGNNNGKLFLSWDEAARVLGLGKGTVGRAFDELEQKGFIKMTRRGHWYGRMATTWSITDRGQDGYPASHDYFQWKRPANAEKTKVGIGWDHGRALTGQAQNRGTNSWSAPAPVKACSAATNGAATDHLYNHAGVHSPLETNFPEWPLRGKKGEEP